jgi:hypothetical protein
VYQEPHEYEEVLPTTSQIVFNPGITVVRMKPYVPHPLQIKGKGIREVGGVGGKETLKWQYFVDSCLGLHSICVFSFYLQASDVGETHGLVLATDHNYYSPVTELHLDAIM